jgi:hypothetical protein
MGSVWLACGTTDVVPFPGLALSKSSEGWGCGIPPFAECAEDGAPLFVVVRVTASFSFAPSGLAYHLLLSPTACAPSASLRAGCGLHSFAALRLGSISWRACGTTEVVPFPGVALSESSEGWDWGIPCLAKDARHGAVLGRPALRPRGLKPGSFWGALRGAEAPLFHGPA